MVVTRLEKKLKRRARSLPGWILRNVVAMRAHPIVVLVIDKNYTDDGSGKENDDDEL